MSIKNSEYLDAVAIKYRTLSYNDLAPKAVTGELPKIDLSFGQVVELLGPYCGVRVLDQLKAAKNSIKSVEAKILKTHLKECVKETLAEKSDFDTKVEEILKVLKR